MEAITQNGGFYVTKDHHTDLLEFYPDLSMVGIEHNYQNGEQLARALNDDDVVLYTAMCDGFPGVNLFLDWAKTHKCIRVEIEDDGQWIKVNEE